MINLYNWLEMMMDSFTFYGGGGKGGGSDSVEQTTTNTPWSGVQPHIKSYLSQANQQNKKAFDFNQGDQIAPFSPEQEYGLTATTQRAINGSPVLNSAQKNAYDSLEGKYLTPDSNPYLKQNVDRALGDASSRVNSQFNNSNFGGSTHQEMMTRNLSDTAAGIYGQNYTTERQNQLNYSGMSPQLAETDYRDAQALMGVGDARQGLAQQYLNQANGLFDANNNYGQEQLNNYGNAVSIGLGAGGTSTSTAPNPNQSSPIAGLIGGGLSLAGLLGGGGLFG